VPRIELVSLPKMKARKEKMVGAEIERGINRAEKRAKG